MRCPICRSVVEPAEEGQRRVPFCSKRCQQIDLGNWLGEAYGGTLPEATQEAVQSQADGEDAWR
jgi:uncharacterized protein